MPGNRGSVRRLPAAASHSGVMTPSCSESSYRTAHALTRTVWELSFRQDNRMNKMEGPRMRQVFVPFSSGGSQLAKDDNVSFCPRRCEHPGYPVILSKLDCASAYQHKGIAVLDTSYNTRSRKLQGDITCFADDTPASGSGRGRSPTALPFGMAPRTPPCSGRAWCGGRG